MLKKNCVVCISHYLELVLTSSAGNSILVSHDTHGVGTVINRMVASFLDDGNDYDYIRYRNDGGPAASYLHGTSDLFELNTGKNTSIHVHVKLKSAVTKNDYDFKFRQIPS